MDLAITYSETLSAGAVAASSPFASSFTKGSNASAAALRGLLLGQVQTAFLLLLFASPLFVIGLPSSRWNQSTNDDVFLETTQNVHLAAD